MPDVIPSEDVTWRFELHATLDAARKATSKQNRTPLLQTRSEVKGRLTADRMGLMLFPFEGIEGYYITDAGSLVSDPEFCDQEWSQGHISNRFLALIYIKSLEDTPVLVGIFHHTTWEEIYDSGETTAATFRFPSTLLSEYKNYCSMIGISQAEPFIKTMWEIIREERAFSCQDGEVKLGNGITIPFGRSGLVDLPNVDTA